MARQRDIIDIEMWRDVPGFDGIYQASSHGRIRRFPRIVASKAGSLKLCEFVVLSCRNPKHSNGYIDVALVAPNGRQVRTSAHSVVCAAFHGPRPARHYQAAHFDGNRKNNRADNLRWATAQENADDRLRHGTSARGERNWKTTLTESDVLAIRAAHRPGYGGYTPLVEEYGITRGAIHRIVKRKNWKHI